MPKVHIVVLRLQRYGYKVIINNNNNSLYFSLFQTAQPTYNDHNYVHTNTCHAGQEQQV